jgi:hypothetical protein
MYEVCPDNFRKIAIKEKQLWLRHFVFLAFVNMATSDLHAFQAALSLPPERLGEVCCRAISRNPISVLIGGLLSENEASQLSLPPAASQTARTLFKTVKDSRPSSLRPPHMP